MKIFLKVFGLGLLRIAYYTLTFTPITIIFIILFVGDADYASKFMAKWSWKD
jgi:hypothetical protein